MANQLKKYFSTLDQIQQGYTINSWHVSQSIDAFTGSSKYDVKISGSLEATYFYSNGVYGNTLYGESSSITTYQFTIDDIHQVITNPDITLNMSSSYTLYETQYKCTVEETEFNVSQNTTLLRNNPREIQLENQGEPSVTVIKNEKDEDGTLKSFATSSFFNPYVTTVGLYNDAYELLAVAKLSQPLPTSHFNNMNIIVKMDQL